MTAVHEESIETDEVIVNGDLFDSWDFRRLKSSHWKILSRMRQIAKHKRIVWISGNHDGPSEMISHLIGLDFVDEYFFENGGRKFLILHGDVFDDFISGYPILTKIADQAYRVMQRFSRDSALAAKRRSKTFLRCSEHVKQRAKSYASSKGMDVVCCGHTHFAEEDDSGGVAYYNCGCWTENACHYLVVKNGSVSIKQI